MSSFTQPAPVYKVHHLRRDGFIFTATGATAGTTVNRLFGEGSTLTTFTGRDGAFRPCSHQRLVIEPEIRNIDEGMHSRYVQNGTSSVSYVSGFTTSCDVHVFNRRYAEFTTRANALSVSLSSLNWDALGHSALQAMLPAIGGDNSLANTLIELRDFRHVLRGIGRRGTNLCDLLRDALRQARGEDMDKPLKKLAKAHLSYEFMVAPLIREIQTLYSTIRGMDSRLRDIIRRANTPQQRYYGFNIAGTEGSPSTVLYQGPDEGLTGGAVGTSFILPLSRVQVTSVQDGAWRYSATVRYKYTIPQELTQARGQWKAFLDVVGLNGNPAILWNAVPFSFVVDWFVNVGKLLSFVRQDNLPLKSEILDFTHSVRAQKTIRYWLSSRQYRDSAVPYWAPYVVTDTATKKVYERRTGIPNPWFALLTSGLSGREAVLTASMITANRPNKGFRGRR